ncbi:MAG: tryptophan synthase subunit alpha [Pseudomonadota bacterium]|nr:tryptophan synthase subunit alpha [Pseudomonadota bacterium]
MNRIDQCFSTLAEQGKKAVIPYVTAGFPEQAATVDVMHAMVAAGAHIIELGVPFSDPMADGPVIQKACEVSLERGMTLQHVLEMVQHFRETDQKTPVVLMGYLNPFEAYGYERFAQAAAQVGIDGILAVDLPPEDSQIFQPYLEAAGIHSIYLLAPTSSDSRIQEVAKKGAGYVYYVSLKGVTGSAALDAQDVKQHVDHLKAYIKTPICVGFGISDGASAKAIVQHADGVIVGSAYIKALSQAESGQWSTAVGGLTEDLVTGVEAL